ncbi:MAG: c-type cytochrome [Ignavibacteriae bacterium]|nr:c-type cytochrome [Ignavibacteriota bacterium]
MPEEKPNIPVEQKDYSKLYLIFSAILFLGTAWAVWDEVKVRRPWKDYQEGYQQLLVEHLDSLRAAAESELDSATVVDLNAQRDKAVADLQSEEYQEAVSQKNVLLKDLDLATREWRFARSRSDAAYYSYQKAMLEGGDAASAKAEVQKHEDDIADYAKEIESLNAKIAELDVTINKYNDQVEKLNAEITGMFATINAHTLKLERTREMPIAIRQVMLNDYEFTPFQEIKARIDRCQTCHAGWAEPLMADAPQPYTQHPLPELLSKHNPESFGCTPCHRGQGPALTAGFAHGDDDHYWETPILRGIDVYATCNSCHVNETVLKYAAPFTKAKQIILDSGCNGCHNIKGFEEAPKIGPPLNSLPKKVQADWLFRWVRNPKDYNEHTRMPNFKLSNEEAEAITAFLMDVGKDAEFQFTRSRGSYAGGSSARGKLLFESVGCQACHTVGDEQTVRTNRALTFDIAPELTRVGSKVSADWMFDWIKNPRHYNPETRMPSLRLTDDEARNIVAYLNTLKDTRTFERTALDLNNPDKIKFGDKLVRDYGCFGCHAIKGTENEGKVSVDLSDFGRKKYEQMDFGNTHELSHDDTTEYQENSDGTVSVKHSWAGWVYGKLKNPRLYETERIPQRMPVFTFNDEEIRLIRMFLTSMTKDVPVANYQHNFNKRQQEIEAGRRLTQYYNCIQCHEMEGRGGYILTKYEEEAMGPPKIFESQGAKVQEPWLHEFLQGPTTIRPWLDIRMPTFNLTDAEISTITKYFLGTSKQELMIRDYAATPIDSKYLAPGRQLFDAYQCAKCHPAGRVSSDEVSASDLAPNLTMAASRLKPEWILSWLHDPQALQPGTRMPAYFYEGKGPDESVFDGVETEQIKALRAHVWSLGRQRSTASK